jgi:Predicted HD superfamily hydrolase
MENRLEILRLKIDKLIKEKQPEMDKYFYVHLYSVSQFCTLLALKRNLDVELATTCGMLHDIYPVFTGSYDNHGIKGAEKARKILKEMNLYNDEEISLITNAISRHSDKNIINGPYDEILKDGDVMSHCLYNNDFPISEKEIERYNKILKEFGCK